MVRRDGTRTEFGRARTSARRVNKGRELLAGCAGGALTLAFDREFIEFVKVCPGASLDPALALLVQR